MHNHEGGGHLSEPTSETAVLAGGCFWCLEPVFAALRGVEQVEPGYTGGHVEQPTYRQVCTGTTGHAEAVRIVYDPKAISFRQLLEVFFAIHDPTTRDRQGADVGPQYRSAIFYDSPAQKATAEQVIAELNASGTWDSAIVTQLTPLEHFYAAEDYHYNYYEENPQQPYCSFVITPKLAKFRAKFAPLLKEDAATK
jgi:peptide-methionine (S)-S-oxide reductase